jgi:hypothetical protein
VMGVSSVLVEVATGMVDSSSPKSQMVVVEMSGKVVGCQVLGVLHTGVLLDGWGVRPLVRNNT